MTNRKLEFIVKDQRPLMLGSDRTVREACRAMAERAAGSVLVVDARQCLCGIFTGRDAVRLLAKGGDAGATPLAKAMTCNPVTIAPEGRAIDALRSMCDCGFRHVPVAKDGCIYGVVSRGDLKGMELESLAWHSRGGAPEEARHRALGEIIRGQRPLLHALDDTVQDACRSMRRRKSGSALVVDGRRRLKGIFTGRDAVRILAKAGNAAGTRLAKAMTRDPVTLPATARAIDALRAMNEGGFRHLPVLEDGSIVGIVSRSDFTGIEIDRLDEEQHLKECIW